MYGSICPLFIFQAEIRIDGKHTAHATAPGINDILNEGRDAFFGAEVPGRSTITRHAPTTIPAADESVLRDVRHGFIGCMKRIQLNGVELPRRTGSRNSEATLLQLAQVQMGCHISATDELGPCASMPCQNGGQCEATSKTGFLCRCPARFSGTFCENDSNPCGSAPCLVGVCTDRLPNDFHCTCPTGLTGKRCEYGKYCNPNPCQNGGCEEGTLAPICQCFSGWEGTHCERDVDECQQSPCYNGGVCHNLLGGFRCNCSVQTRGSFCEEIVYIPSMSGFTPWSWLEILVMVAVIVVLFVLAILGVLCRRKFRKRRTVPNSVTLLNDHSIGGSPCSQTGNNNNNNNNNNLNNPNVLNNVNDELARNKMRERTRIGPDDLMKRGSKISNLEVEARQPFLQHNSDGQGVASSSLRSGSMYAKTRFRHPPLTPPLDLSSASSETVSVRQKSTTNLNVTVGENDPDVVKACVVVDLPTRSASSSPSSGKSTRLKARASATWLSRRRYQSRCP